MEITKRPSSCNQIPASTWLRDKARIEIRMLFGVVLREKIN
jgi:hypothetical protein